jgi:hypothetical protein
MAHRAIVVRWISIEVGSWSKGYANAFKGPRCCGLISIGGIMIGAIFYFLPFTACLGLSMSDSVISSSVVCSFGAL